MATFTKAGISTGQTIQATHVTQIIDAFTKSGSYDLYASGSAEFTGSVKSYSGFTGSLQGTASVAVTSSYSNVSGKTEATVVDQILGNITSNTFKVIGGVARIPQGQKNSTAIAIAELGGKTLGQDCFISVGYSSSVSASDMKVGVEALNGAQLTFTYDTGAGVSSASVDVDFFFTILYTA